MRYSLVWHTENQISKTDDKKYQILIIACYTFEIILLVHFWKYIFSLSKNKLLL